MLLVFKEGGFLNIKTMSLPLSYFKITTALCSQTSWANNEDKLFKRGVKYKTTYYGNGVNSNPTTTAESYQVFSPPQH